MLTTKNEVCGKTLPKMRRLVDSHAWGKQRKIWNSYWEQWERSLSRDALLEPAWTPWLSQIHLQFPQHHMPSFKNTYVYRILFTVVSAYPWFHFPQFQLPEINSSLKIAEYSIIGYFERQRDHIHIAFNTVYCSNYLILLLIIFVTLLLCLIYKLCFTIGTYVQEKTVQLILFTTWIWTMSSFI